MFLVRLIDVFVGILEFIFKSEKRGQGASPAVLGTAGIITLVVLMALAIGVPQWRYHARTEPFTAELGNAAGLTPADPVLIAGVPAGRIEGIRLAGDHVKVDFRLDRKQPLGDQTRATVRLRTVLGKRYFELMPAGRDTGQRNIPLERTEASYTLDQVSSAALKSSTEVDATVVREMLKTMETLIPNPDSLSAAMAGAGGAAVAISGTGAQLDQLLSISKRLAQASANQSDSISTAMANTQSIVQTLVVRRYVITRLADNLRLVLAKMAETFPRIPMGELTRNIMAVTGTLKDNADTIDRILKTLPPAMRTITDATGNGNWADVVSPSAVIPDGLLCVLGTMQGCS